MLVISSDGIDQFGECEGESVEPDQFVEFIFNSVEKEYGGKDFLDRCGTLCRLLHVEALLFDGVRVLVVRFFGHGVSFLINGGSFPKMTNASRCVSGRSWMALSRCSMAVDC